MKKYTKFLFASIVSVSLSMVGVAAYYNTSGWTLSPKFVLDQPASSFEYNLISEDNTLYVSECYVEIEPGWLEDYHAKEPHDFPVKLMDSDWGLGNDDDYLKDYEIMFGYDGKMLYAEYQGYGDWSPNEPVDSDGDDQGELYIEGTMFSVSDYERIMANGRGASMFEFQILTE